MTGFFDAAEDLLRTERRATEVRLYFYAVTVAGWQALAPSVASWTAARRSRSAIAYVGTDHALTDADALRAMQDAGVGVRLLIRYNGVYHPKMIWFYEGGCGHILVGSNNLTLDGLKSNIEFATLTRLSAQDQNLSDWHTAVDAASDPLTDILLNSYMQEKEAFGRARARAQVAASFTWSKRTSAAGRPRTRGPGPAARTTPSAAAGQSARVTPATAISDGARPGDLIVEIMPLETGPGGSQIQIPMDAASNFFRLPTATGSQLTLSLRNLADNSQRSLTMTRFGNSTARLVIRELDYRDRPCVIRFRPRSSARSFDFEIVRRAIDPNRYRSLYNRCGAPTRTGSRRWIIVP